MLSNMAASLIMHKRINTTVAKAKALRKYVEPLLTKSKTDSTASRRMVFTFLQDKEAVTELFRDVAAKISDRPGGYTRILKLGHRRGDSADIAQIELVGSEYDPNAEVEKVDAGDKPAPKKGLGARLKATADRVRGKKDDGSSPAPKSSTRAAGGRKVSTPRKSGGGS